MIKSTLHTLKSQWLFFAGYAIVCFIGLYFIFQYEKTEGHILLNSYYNSFFDTFFKVITYLGDGFFSVIVLAIFLFINWRKALVGILSFGLASLITQLLKKTIYDDVKRPFLALWDYYHSAQSHLVLEKSEMQFVNSFPSGHTTTAFAIFTFLALSTNNKVFGMVCLVFALFTAYSRVYLSQHFVEDIIAGSVIGMSVSLMVFSIYNYYVFKKVSKN